MNFTDFAVIIGAYLLGALPFSVWFSRAFGLPDPRATGSGNPGATNVARSNKIAAFLTLLADAGKGFLPIWFLEGETAAAAGVAAVLGHVFSVFLRFRGGKGVATALGVFAAWSGGAGIAAVAVWGLVFVTCRISSVSSVAAIVAATIAMGAFESPFPLAAAAIGILVVARHRRNIVDVWRGHEKGFNSTVRYSSSSPLRMILASMILSGVVFSLASVHDYRITRNQISKIRAGDEIAVQRPWIAVFFFFNEAGSGMKYWLTGNRKHMRHYPHAEYLRTLSEEQEKEEREKGDA